MVLCRSCKTIYSSTFTAYPSYLLWWGEIILGAVLPIILLSLPAVRHSRSATFWSSVLVILGLVFNRFNVSMLAMDMQPGTVYFPHWMEFAISVGLVADALLVIWLAYRFLPIAGRGEAVEVRIS